MTPASEKLGILFVDDEPLVLQGLQRMLRPMRNQWEMSFVESGASALELLGQTSFQVVVSDMLMPGMNGATLLLKVKELYPHTVRLILSGHADKALIMKCLGTAHQFLAKPCEPDALRNAINRASDFDTLKSDRLKEFIGQLDCLPSVPVLLNQIVEKVQDANCSLEDVGVVIRQDLAMTAKLLKLVNSAFFGIRRQISNPSEAISFLGLETIKSLVLALEAFSTFEGKSLGPITLDGLWAHSLAVAALSKSFATDCTHDRQVVEESFIGGMLHDIGKLVLAVNLPEDYAKVYGRARDGSIPLSLAEESLFGASHGDIGGYLLSLWGLPGVVVDAITFHHCPERNREKTFTATTAVHIANVLCHEAAASSDLSVLNDEYVESLGLMPNIEKWRNG